MVMRRRPVVVRRGTGLVGTMARTAVVAGTATVTANAINKRQMGKQQTAADDAAQQQAAAQQAAQQPAPQPPGGDLMAQLNQLAQLKASGVLSDEEFTAAKAKLLGT